MHSASSSFHLIRPHFSILQDQGLFTLEFITRLEAALRQRFGYLNSTPNNYACAALLHHQYRREAQSLLAHGVEAACVERIKETSRLLATDDERDSVEAGVDYLLVSSRLV